jgi:hypothetical protein
MIEDIMSSNRYRQNNLLSKQGHPEAVIPEYDILMLSKPFLLDLVANLLNPYNSTYFVWLDAGYGHGMGEIFPPHSQWNPADLLNHPDKVTNSSVIIYFLLRCAH